MRLMDIFAIAIGAFNPARIDRDRQPHARMSQSAFSAITGDPVGLNNLGLRRINAHGALRRVAARETLCDSLAQPSRDQVSRAVPLCPEALRQPADHTALRAIARLHLQASFQWTRDPRCTNNQTGPPFRVTPSKFEKITECVCMKMKNARSK